MALKSQIYSDVLLAGCPPRKLRAALWYVTQNLKDRIESQSNLYLIFYQFYSKTLHLFCQTSYFSSRLAKLSQLITFALQLVDDNVCSYLIDLTKAYTFFSGRFKLCFLNFLMKSDFWKSSSVSFSNFSSNSRSWRLKIEWR